MARFICVTVCYNFAIMQSEPYRFSIEEYEHLAEMWCENERFELLNGEIYTKPHVGPAHSFSVARLAEQFILLSEHVAVMSRSPLQLPPDSETEPDIALLKLPKEQYRSRLPRGEDVLLLVEVSKNTLEYDRSKKLPIYARAEIPEVWIHNLIDNQLEVYRNPQNERYTSLSTYAAGREVAPSMFGNNSIRWWLKR